MTEFRIEQGGRVLRSRGRYGAGEAHSPARVETRLRHSSHVFACVGVVVAGNFEFRTPNGAALATPGTILFGNTAEEFSYRYCDERGARRSVIAFSDELMREAADEFACEPRFKVATVAPTRASLKLYGRARRIAAADIPLEDDVLELLSDALSLNNELPAANVAPAVTRRMRELARFIDHEYTNQLKLAELAAMARVSKFHFVRAFGATIGESPGRYLIAARLRAAANQLLETRDAVASIALQVGFNDLSHFNLLFRDTFGKSPRAWRQAK